ncbi:Rieske 2Fe-2S domain-containing protein [Amycolatopsis pithecellobii]|uniref:Rieske 2Fe-2S domain-containing protein n=1 Tax=Amycolatopsis pithecellobii TaxID=664692 RepID=A0A6N7YYT9_9PSEU|nr:Rieske 2Fe-2S domain-containing protein [Amycolatopsis pithecellobii]MTD57042.1 Rieske 2Fe-2S domain-containing protein [Amycolatopsis pithecellobii]
MLTVEENERLTRVGPQTPMGKMLRRYWLPALSSAELVAGGAPRAVRLLGEDLVAFRGDDGVVGVLAAACPHRGASLVLAKNADCALQCLYHGWKIAPDGRILDMPAEPEDTRYLERIRQVAYPVREAGALVWVYLGPAELEPEFPAWDWTSLPDEHILVGKAVAECNWVQCLEGAIDSAHQTYLHDSASRIERDRNYARWAAEQGLDPTDGFDETGQIVRPWADGRPKLQIEDTDFGFSYAAIRKPLFKEDEFKNVRVTHFVAPVHAAIPSPAGWSQLIIHVPMDDYTTAFYHVRANLEAPYDEETARVHKNAAGLVPGVDLDENFYKLANKSNLWKQDREEMKRDRFSGIRGTVTEDQAVQESMGPIFDRSKEHLATSDMAVIRMRRLLMQSLREFEAGAAPIGLRNPIPYASIRGEERTIPLSQAWQSVGRITESS